jgi:molybdate transport system ATP-binding protein
MSAGIELRLKVHVSTFALDVDLALPGRGVTAVCGPSGAGKTLLLRAVAGLERAAGRVAVNGELWQDERVFMPAHRRAVGYVFQESSLFPHLSVRGNLDYARSRSGANGDVAQTARMLGIDALLERRPEYLSGGERQRVAIARALLSHPKLLLLDEPLASLDLPRRAEILPFLERLHDELEIPSLYVTHMPDEAARLADHLVLLERGTVLASGGLQDTLARLDLAGVFGESAAVVVDAQFGGYDTSDGLTRLTFPGGALLIPHVVPARADRLRCRIEARDVSLTLQRQHDTSILNIIPAVVVDAVDTTNPAQLLVRLDAGGSALLARITRRSWQTLRLAPGAQVWAQIKAVALIR